MKRVRLIDVLIHGFGSFQTTSLLSLENRGLAIVTGKNLDATTASSNGAGKSTVFKAISWALYGRTVDGLTTNIRNVGVSFAMVRLNFEVNGETFQIRRKREKSKGILEFRSSSEDFTCRKKSDTQDKIVDIIGVDFDGFRACCLFGQGDTSRFAHPTTSDTERKSLLRRLLGLERYDFAKSYAQLQVSNLKDSYSQLHDELRRLEEERSGLERSLSGVDSRLETFAEFKVKGDARLAEARSEAEAAIEKHKTAKAAFESFETSASMGTERERLSRERSGKESELKELQFERRSIKKRLSQLGESGECPLCGGEVGDYCLQEEKDRLVQISEGVSRLEPEIEELRRLEKGVCSEIKANELHENALEREAVDAWKEVQSAKKERLSLECQVQEIDADIEEAKTKRNLLRGKLSWAEKRIKAREEKSDSIRDDIACWSWWARFGFGPKGVPAFAIEQTLPALNVTTNKHLGLLSGGDIEVVWTATTKTTKGTEKEVLCCSVLIEGQKGVTPSGGQLRKIELATELALAELAGESGGTSFNCLFFDEALDGLDEIARGQVVSWIRSLEKESVFVVSHTSELAEEFETEVRVTKQDGMSSIRVI